MAPIVHRAAVPSPGVVALALAVLLTAALFGLFEPGRAKQRVLTEVRLSPTRGETSSIIRASGVEARLTFESPGAYYFRQTASFQDLVRALESAEN